MAWMYRCEMDNVEITAENKEQLVDKVMQHGNEIHNMNMTQEDARKTVEENAVQAA